MKFLLAWTFALLTATNVAYAVPIKTTTVNFEPTTGSSFTFQWEEPANCNPADGTTCFITDIDWTDPDGISWTDPAFIASFSATFNTLDELIAWEFRLLDETVTPVMTDDAMYDSVSQTGAVASNLSQYDEGASFVRNCKNLTTDDVCSRFAGGGGAGTVVDTSSWSFQTTTAVPEPTTLALMGLGIAGLGFRRKVR